MSLKLTDEAVAMLPLQSGRAELLEEIMSTVAPDRTTVETVPARRPSRWLVPVAAAAAVAAIAAGSLWAAGLLPESESQTAAQPDTPAAGRAVLEAAGWTVARTESGADGYGEVHYEKGSGQFTVTWYPAQSYDDYVTDREHIYDPPGAGEKVEVLGKHGQLWAYSPDDHTVIREVENGLWFEFRGSGMGKADYLTLLGRLKLVGDAGYEASLPDEFVTDVERKAAIASMLAGITDVTGVDGPGGAPVRVRSGQQDPYQLGAAVAGAYACSWLEAYENAVAHGQQDQADEALRVLGTSREWPILVEMDEQGDYPEVVWQIADEAKATDLQDWYREGLGC
jgi:hypothetical protein